MQLKKVLVSLGLAGVVMAAGAQGIDAVGTAIGNVASGSLSEANTLILASIAMVATIVRRALG